MKLNVLIVDDHKLFRDGLKLLLKTQSFIKEINEAENGKQFIEYLATHQPDVVLLDVAMPEMNGIEALQIALTMQPTLKVIVLSMFSEEEYYTKMIELGAKGFVLKNSDIADVREALLSVSAGKTFFSHEILNSLMESMHRKKEPERVVELSDREQEVLSLICEGLSNQEIADKLHLSKRTVDKHRENIMLKTGCKNTATLVMLAIKQGIVKP